MWLFNSEPMGRRQARNWVRTWLQLIILVLTFNVALNYVVDPFGVFRSSLFPYQFQINERYLKIEHLKANHARYDTYLFGSSRIGTTQPGVVEAYLPGSHAYNFTVASANVYEYLAHLEYFLKEGYTVKNLYIQVDIDSMAQYGRHENDDLRRLHPDVVGESKLLYLGRYLFGFYPKNIKRKLMNNLERHDYLEYDLENGGAWQRAAKEQAMREDCCAYVASEPSFHARRQRKMGDRNLENTIAAIDRIRRLCREHGISLYLFTMAQNSHTMDTFRVNAYLEFLKRLADSGSYTDFSGYNSVTLNDCNYYEWSHYRPHVARWIAARMFHDASVSVPEDFGMPVTKENRDAYLRVREETIRKESGKGACHPLVP